MCEIRVCEIRFASTSVICRNLYPVCKNNYLKWTPNLGIAGFDLHFSKEIFQSLEPQTVTWVEYKMYLAAFRYGQQLYMCMEGP